MNKKSEVYNNQQKANSLLLAKAILDARRNFSTNERDIIKGFLGSYRQEKSPENNAAFIDAQNLFLGTTSSPKPWRVDLSRFRTYLKQKYKVMRAFYFLGFHDNKYEKLYSLAQKAGFELIFRAHSKDNRSNKKGNVDTDIVFSMMKEYCSKQSMIFLVSGDGDYYKTADYLRRRGRLGKVLFPSVFNFSSLYRKLGRSYYDYLDFAEVRKKIELTKKRASLR